MLLLRSYSRSGEPETLFKQALQVLLIQGGLSARVRLHPTCLTLFFLRLSTSAEFESLSQALLQGDPNLVILHFAHFPSSPQQPEQSHSAPLMLSE